MTTAEEAEPFMDDMDGLKNDWLEHEYTRRLAKLSRENFLRAQLNLISKANNSSDPEVRDAARLVADTKLQYEVFSGKTVGGGA